jgi:hypothetical protein
MSGPLRKLPPLLLACAALVALGGCGDSHKKTTTGTYAGESGANAPYLDVGPLKYEIQQSRQLNPFNSEDSKYLTGLTAEQAKLEPGQEWFGVFVQVYNTGSSAAPAAATMSISDTQGNVYQPLKPTGSNEYAYHGGVVQGKGQIPEPDTPPYFGPTQGAMLLFKIQTESLSNRPLEVKIADPLNPSETASAELDV